MAAKMILVMLQTALALRDHHAASLERGSCDGVTTVALNKEVFHDHWSGSYLSCDVKSIEDCGKHMTYFAKENTFNRCGVFPFHVSRGMSSYNIDVCSPSNDVCTYGQNPQLFQKAKNYYTEACIQKYLCPVATTWRDTPWPKSVWVGSSAGWERVARKECGWIEKDYGLLDLDLLETKVTEGMKDGHFNKKIWCECSAEDKCP